MARSVPLCGKVAMGGFTPEASGSNRVRAHRRMQPNLQPYVLTKDGTTSNVLVCTRCRRTATKSAR
jgi:ribosomal protein L28